MATAPEAASRPIASLVRQHGSGWLAELPDPHEQWMTLLWGPRFDRDHARTLVNAAGAAAPRQRERLRDAMDAAAGRFDGLAAAEQQRLRELVLRHWLRAQAQRAATITPCTASC